MAVNIGAMAEATPLLPRVPEPADFDAYWAAVAGELDRMEVAPEVELIPLRSSAEVRVYAARFTSIGPYRLFAYYAVPSGAEAGEGPWGVDVRLPGYASVVGVPVGGLDRRWSGNRAVLQLCHRGQRLSDRPYAAAFPGLLTDGIESPETYVWRGIVADACRAVDFVLTRPMGEAYHADITVSGNDLALFVAALRGKWLAGVRVSPSLFYRLADVLPQTHEYPLEEFNDYLRTYPERAEAVALTLSYFDPLHAAQRAACPVQTGVSEHLAPLREALGERARAPGR
ncbi:MAG: acetylxylan esterase [Chloroflexi bacterium]|nr:acetylxylan esterase [Chloroflexota bacterium]